MNSAVEQDERKLPDPAGRPFLAAGFFLVLLTVVLIATNVWLAWRSYDAAWSQATTTSRNLGHSVANQLDSVFSEVDRLLNTLSYTLERNEMTPAALESLQPIMVTQISQAEYLHGLFVYGADGRWLVHTQPTQARQANNSDREYFIRHRESRSTRVLISKPVQSRSTGDWIIPVSKRIDDAEGRFAGVLLATVRVDHILQLLNRFDIGEGGAISLGLADGTNVLRRPYAVEDLGRLIPDNPLMQAVNSARAGIARLTSPIDGVKRLVVFEHLPNNPLFVTIALSEKEILSQWRSAAQVQLACVLLVVLVIGFSGRYIIKSLRLRRASDRALRAAHEQIVQKNAQLAELAERDGLTGMLNRRAFDQRFEDILLLGRRHGRPVAVLLFDVDHFKAYNDRYGHPAGDECLRRVAAALSQAIRRPGDVLARYGGEEFIAVLPDTDADGALAVGNAAREEVERLKLPHGASVQGIVTVSCGVASAFRGLLDPTTGALIEQADKALYRAKDQGRNRVVVAGG
ncbi:GGDEF domain-containing protein [Comamonas endophytica]|uniref:diguanylate cyclase n=1 Tax=Comamonas endophytica TaxID=2949090 RepID=A0ABY6GEM4_9BURK|nr:MULTISPECIES: sensor domain-containing diguanylate cyclase [unclassified Acidovorax]MCD2514299.1 sensor domain-containing diguanylate cyclase [Acidovorax sp. D4N7]UYG53549.1 sensor domain-containing diguanylate cyclase [Acidovorax sp. 5MLIR]